MVELGGDAKIPRSVENVSERSNADEAGRGRRELREGRSIPRGTSRHWRNVRCHSCGMVGHVARDRRGKG